MFSGVAMAQVQSGKVYRIVSKKYGTVITENLLTHQLSCVEKGTNTDFQQMWEFTINDEKGKYVINNVLTQRILQNESATNVQFKTGTDSVYFVVKENTNALCKGTYNIDASNKAGGWGLHCAGHAVVVPWSYGPDKDGISGSEWVFEEVSITEAQKEEAYLEYQAYNSINENKETIIEKVSALFTDNTGTVLKSEYATKSDAELKAVMEGVPESLQLAILKIKNNKWDATTREKDFRIYTYKPYSNPTKWNEILYTRIYSAIDNPTGICSSSDKDYLYVWVEDIPAGSYIELREVPGTRWDGNHTRLTKGLNIVPTSIKDGVFYICYVADTHTGFSLKTSSGPKKLADFKPVKIHIEGGYVNGFWSKERGHTNADWTYMKQNMFKNPTAIQAKGTHTLLSFRTKEFLQECPANIEGIIRLWDFWNKTQHKYMALDRYYDYFNNLQLAMSDDTGFMDAGNWRTHYNNNTLNTIVNYDLLIRDAGSSWGPNHEIGHNNQYAFEIVGTSEVSNNALANMVIFDQGTHTSRGVNLNDQILDFENNVPYVLRGEKEYGQKLFSMTRMYFQLFLYAHAAGKCPDFYPRLFEELRRDKLIGWSVGSSDELDENGFYKNSVNALKDQLKFAEKCCEIMQMDLSEFFEAWGFFIPFKNGFVGDYGHHWVYLLEEDVKASKARMQKYPKKGGHLMFLEDRVRHSKKKKSEINPDDDSSYRIDYSTWEYPIGEWAGFFGQWEDYIDETVKVQDGAFFYAVVGNKIVIKQVGDKKGVLGFKLYDGNGKLLSYTNRYEMNIPLTADRSNFRVVAAQPDGSDAEIKHIKDGPANLQKEALTNSLQSAEKYLNRTTTDTASKRTIGKFHVEALAELQTIYDNAKADSGKIPAQREKTDVEWSEMLDAECLKVANDENAMIRLEEGAQFILKGKNNKKLERTGNGVIAQNSKLDNTLYAWSIEYSDVPGCFYLKDKDGMYMRDFSLGDMVDSNEQSTASAQKFTYGYTDDGKLFFSSYPNSMSFGVDNSGGVVKMALTEDGTWWTAQYISSDFDDESHAFYTEEFNNTLAVARVYVEEIINPAAIGTMNIFSKKILVLDETLTFAAQELYNTYMQASNDVENVSKHKEYLNTLREKIYNVQGKYIVKAPVTTYAGRVMWYRIRNCKTDKYLSVNPEDNGLVPVSSFNVDDNALWCFAPVSGDQYEMYSAATKGFIYSEGTNLHAGSQERVPVTITYDESKEAVTIAMDAIVNNKPQKGLMLQESGSVVKLARSGDYWVLEFVAVEDNEELAGELFLTGIEDVVEEVGNYEGIYDLQGRKIINPARGIYIQNGKKVIFE